MRLSPRRSPAERAQAVTPSMVRAALAELSGYRPGWDSGEETVTRMYRAMAAAGRA